MHTKKAILMCKAVKQIEHQEIAFLLVMPKRKKNLIDKHKKNAI